MYFTGVILSFLQIFISVNTLSKSYTVRKILKYSAIAVVMAVTIGTTNLVSAQDVTNPSLVGLWSKVYSWPVYGVHLALMPDQKVLVWDSTKNENPTFNATANTSIWDPLTGQHTPVSNASLEGQELFCSPHTHLPDGNLLVVTGIVGKGDPAAVIFDNASKKWVRQPNLNYARYYPSATSLPNGGVLVTGGGYPNNEGDTPEKFESGNWQTLTDAKISFADTPRGFIDNTSYFPWAQPAPNGQVFYAGPENTLRYIDTAGAGGLQTVGQRGDNIFRDYGSYAMYDIGKVLVVGGGPAPKSTYVIDINNNSPLVTQSSSLTYGRRQQNLTILADGQVLVTGGNSNSNSRQGEAGSQFDLNTSVYAAEIWNPTTGQWKLQASMAKPRQYHSTALLIPDGRVVVAGGICTPCQKEQNAEIFSPPYLFNTDGTPAERPDITSAPASTGYKEQFTVTLSKQSSIVKAHLIKLGSVTHATNFDQRLVPLSFTQADTTLNITAPDNNNIAPPGYYMLFVVNSAGVPSIAKTIQVGGNPLPVPQPPSVQIPLNQQQSIQSFDNPNYYVRHSYFLGYITAMNASSPDLDKNDSTFKVVPGLASAQCVSFESKNFPGYFLRSQDFRVKLQPQDNSAVFKSDATFCPEPGLADTSKVSFRLYSDDTHYIRHRDNELWVDSYSSDTLYKSNATFQFVTAWNS